VIQLGGQASYAALCRPRSAAGAAADWNHERQDLLEVANRGSVADGASLVVRGVELRGGDG
jgi:hypothetical protein